jgi:Leucine-rich repeat (LRR) protein
MHLLPNAGINYHAHYAPKQSVGMAVCSLSSLLLLTLSASVFISAFMAARADDQAALLALKVAAISGRYDDPIPSWNGSTGGYCSWEGVRCRGRVALSLPYRRFTGVLSPSIGNLSSLRILNFSFNAFSEAIPATLGRLRHLRVLDLSRNTFSGEFPVNLTSCINLKTIFLRYNQLHGGVPSEIGNKPTGLRVLSLDNNRFTGAIPESLGNISSLYYLEIAFNQIEGTIPSSLGDIMSMQYLTLAFNKLSGEPPLSLYSLSSLRWLQLQGNMLPGCIPADIGSRLPSILTLGFFSNHFTGPIPASVSNLTQLHTFDISENSLSGYVPRTLGRLRALRYLDFGNNILETDNRKGWEFITSLSNCSQLFYLVLSGNAAFTGQLPSSISNLSTNLPNPGFDNTGISGSIPSAIGNLVSLQILSGLNTSIQQQQQPNLLFSSKLR